MNTIAMPAAQALRQLDIAAHLTTRGQGPRSPLLVMPARLGVERQHSQQVVESAGTEQRAVAERTGLDVGKGAASLLCQDMPDQWEELVRPMGYERRVGTQRAPMHAQRVDVRRIVDLDGVEKALQPLFAHAPRHRRYGNQGRYLLDDAVGQVSQRTAGIVVLVHRWRQLLEQQHRAFAGLSQIRARQALDLAESLVQAFDGRARAAPSKRVAPKTGPEGQCLGSCQCGS